MLTALCGHAQQQITRQEAINAAVNTMRYYGKQDITEKSVANVLTLGQGGPTLIYEVHFNSGESVLLSGNRACKPILGYVDGESEKGNTLLNRFEDLPDGMKFFLESYMEQISYCFTNNVDQSYAAEWKALQKFDNTKASYNVAVGPLLTTKWGQSYSNDVVHFDKHAYNHKVEEQHTSCGSTDSHCPAGCVAVALAQIIKKWGKTNDMPGGCYINYPYEWSEMPNELKVPKILNHYYYSDAYKKRRNAVSQLIRDCGILTRVDYCHLNGWYINEPRCSSGTFHTHVLEALEHFGYYHNDIAYKNDYPQQVWEDLLKDDLDKGYPVYYSGNRQNVQYEGHAFVCDGYDNNHLFHFNWGWNSSGGWFTTSPGSQQISFNLVQGAIYNIHPIDDDNCWPNIKFNCDKDFWNNQSFYASNLISNTNNNFIVNWGVDVSLYAKEIVLTSGFHAKSGSKFHAVILPCEQSKSEAVTRGSDMEESTGIIKEQQSSDFTLYPNPTTGLLNIYLGPEQGTIRQVSILNLFAKEVFKSNCVENGAINVVGFPSGIYIVKIISDKGQTYFSKFVKQ